MKEKIMKSLMLGFGLVIILAVFAVSAFADGTTNTGGNSTTIGFVAHIRGSGSAQITLEEWVDYSDPYGKKFESGVRDILSNYNGNVNLIVKHFPLTVLFPNSEKGAEAAECAAAQGDEYFWGLHDWYMGSTKWTIDDVRNYLTSLSSKGFSIDAFNYCLDSGKMKNVINSYIKEGQSKGISGIPTTFVIRNSDGKTLTVAGAVSYDELKKNVYSLMQADTNKAPVITGTGGSTQLSVGETGTWKVEAYDPENGNLYYSIDWNDYGAPASNTDTKTTTAQTNTFQHTYYDAGTYTITFKVSDSNGASTKATTTVTVIGKKASSCFDTDGLDYYTKGKTSRGNEAIADAEVNIDTCTYCTGLCIPGQPCKSTCGAVVEYYCSNDGLQKTTYVCPNGCYDGACISGSTNSTTDGIIIEQDGEYMLKMGYFNSAAEVTLQMIKPNTVDIGKFYGYYPAMPSEISLGYMSRGTEIVFGHKSAWWGNTYGPFYSTDGKEYQVTKSGNSWTIQMDDGLHIGPDYQDGRFSVYLKGDSGNATICPVENVLCISGTTPETYYGDDGCMHTRCVADKNSYGLGEKIEMHKGKSIIVNNNLQLTLAETKGNTIRCIKAPCPGNGGAAINAQIVPQIWMDSTTQGSTEDSSGASTGSTSGTATTPTVSGYGKVLYLTEGKSEDFGGYNVELLSVSEESAVIVVESGSGTIQIGTVSLGLQDSYNLGDNVDIYAVNNMDGSIYYYGGPCDLSFTVSRGNDDSKEEQLQIQGPVRCMAASYPIEIQSGQKALIGTWDMTYYDSSDGNKDMLNNDRKEVNPGNYFIGFSYGNDASFTSGGIATKKIKVLEKGDDYAETCPAGCKEVAEGCLCPKIRVKVSSGQLKISSDDENNGANVRSIRIEPGSNTFEAQVTTNIGDVKKNIKNEDQGAFVVPVATSSGQVDVSFEAKTETLQTIVSANNAQANTRESLVYENNRIYLSKGGSNKEIKVLPEAASQTAAGNLGTKISNMELKDNGKAVYEASGQKEGKVFGLIPVNYEVKTQISADNGSVQSTDKPWYDFMVQADK